VYLAANQAYLTGNGKIAENDLTDALNSQFGAKDTKWKYTETTTENFKIQIIDSEREYIIYTNAKVEGPLGEVAGGGSTGGDSGSIGGDDIIQPPTEEDINTPETIGIATVGQITEKNSTMNGEKYSSTNPIIPKGFAPINVSGQYPTNWNATNLADETKKGLIITDNTTTRDENGNTIGNEFVWIPVSETDFSLFAELQEESTEDYKGIAYEWRSDGSYYVTTDYREPDIVTYHKPIIGNAYEGSDKSIENLNIAGVKDLVHNEGEEEGTINEYDFKKQLQNEFNNMVKSVAKYGGFYVGRYEISLNGDKAQSVAGAYPKVGSWYELYNKAKTYSNEEIVTEMAWGCQWDAMMRFIGSRATQSGYVGHGRVDFNITVPTIYSYKTAGTNYSEIYNLTEDDEGYVPYNDIINNIYDLEGNLYEWSKEACYDYYRMLRGGNYRDASEAGPSSHLKFYSPGTQGPNSDAGTRMTLYVK